MSLLYKVIRKIVKGCYKEKTVFGAENIPSEPSLIIGNHAQMHGPLYAELYFPRPKKVWCIGEMLNKKEAPAYAYKDFWSYKPKWCKWFYKLLAHVVSPLLVFLFKNSDTIGVYKDTRVLATFKNTVKALKDGEHVVIFPECPQEYNEIVNEFQLHFVDVAKLYYKQTGKRLSFVPTYIAPSLNAVVYGKPIEYDPTMSADTQRKVVCEYIKTEITRLAKELPRHRVVPYANIKKKDYPYSKEY